MTEKKKNTDVQESAETGKTNAADELKEDLGKDEQVDKLKKELAEANDKYVRLYANFENYKKVSERNKEELLKYANEEIISEILTVIDHLELALQHSSNNKSCDALAEGVDLTLKELKNVLEKQGLVTIDALNTPFDPVVHHAMSQIETDDVEENMVVKEFRKGYKLKERILRAALVGVSKKPSRSKEGDDDTEQRISDDETES